MKQKDKWLKKLNSKIILLNENDRRDIISNYSEKIDIELAIGKNINDVLNEQETLDTIAKNIYTEFGINYQAQENKAVEKIGGGVNTILLSILIILPAALAICFGLAALLCTLAVVPAIALAFVNYDTGAAFALSSLFITITPFVLGLFLYLLWVCYKSTKGIGAKIKSINSYSGPSNRGPKKAKKWTFKLILIGLATSLLGASLAWNFLAPDTVLHQIVNNSFLNEKTYTIKREEISGKPEFDFSNMPYGKETWYQIKEEPENADKDIKIVHRFNFKVSQVKDFEFEIKDNKVFISWELQWYMQALSFGPSKIEIYI